MTYQEILHEIGYWLDKDSLNRSQYEMLGKLVMIFCDEFTAKWPPYVDAMLIAVTRKLNSFACECDAKDFVNEVKASIKGAVHRQSELKM